MFILLDDNSNEKSQFLREFLGLPNNISHHLVLQGEIFNLNVHFIALAEFIGNRSSTIRKNILDEHSLSPKRPPSRVAFSVSFSGWFSKHVTA